MVPYAFNSTSSAVDAPSSSTPSSLVAGNAAVPAADGDPLIAVIVVLSIAVLAAIFFVVCGLFLKAEAHVHSGRETISESLLVEPMSPTVTLE